MFYNKIKCEGAKALIRSQRREDNSMAKRKRKDKRTMMYKTIHRKIKNEQHEAHYTQRVNSDAPEGWAVSVQLVTPVVSQT